jgi:hypothetical protein
MDNTSMYVSCSFLFGGLMVFGLHEIYIAYSRVDLPAVIVMSTRSFEHCKHTATINYNPNFISFFNISLTFGSVLLGSRAIDFKTLY